MPQIPLVLPKVSKGEFWREVQRDLLDPMWRLKTREELLSDNGRTRAVYGKHVP
jgi:hypothetical protein